MTPTHGLDVAYKLSANMATLGSITTQLGVVNTDYEFITGGIVQVT